MAILQFSVCKSPIYTLHFKWNGQAATWLKFKFSAVQAPVVYIGPKYDTVTYAYLLKFKGTIIYYTEWVKKYYKKEYIRLHIYTIYPVIKITFCPNSYSLQTVCKVKYKEMTLTYIYTPGLQRFSGICPLAHCSAVLYCLTILTKNVTFVCTLECALPVRCA